MQEAYIVAGFRTAVTKSKKGGFRFFRPDDLAVEVIKGLVATIPQLDTKRVDDVIVGNAVPEAEQGLQFGRIIAAKALGIDHGVAGFRGVLKRGGEVQGCALQFHLAGGNPRDVK